MFWFSTTTWRNKMESIQHNIFFCVVSADILNSSESTLVQQRKVSENVLTAASHCQPFLVSQVSSVKVTRDMSYITTTKRNEWHSSSIVNRYQLLFWQINMRWGNAASTFGAADGCHGDVKPVELSANNGSLMSNSCLIVPFIPLSITGWAEYINETFLFLLLCACLKISSENDTHALSVIAAVCQCEEG